MPDVPPAKVHGRAVVPRWPNEPFNLPTELTEVETFRNPARDLVYVIVEGPGLPSWFQGAEPWVFSDIAELREYVSR